MEKALCASTAPPVCLLKAEWNGLHVNDTALCHRVKKALQKGGSMSHFRKILPSARWFWCSSELFGAICSRVYSLIKEANVIKKLPESLTIHKHVSADTHKSEKYYTAKYSMYKNMYCNISCLLVEIFLQRVSQVQKINQAFKKRLRMIHLVLS